MKIIHTSDWHLGHQLYNYDRLDEHRYFIRQLAAIISRHSPDALIIAGDIFDQQSPSLAAQQLWVEALGELLEADPKVEIIAIAGNHDSGSRLAVHAPLLRKRLHIIGRDPKIIILGEPQTPTGVVAAIPYLPDFAFRRYLDEAEIDSEEDPVEAFYAMMAKKTRQAAGNCDIPRIAVSHIAVSGADTSSHPLRDFNFFAADRIAADFHYHALGHIHFPQSFLNNRVRYSGSPFPLSFDEPYHHSVSLVEVEPGASGLSVETVGIEPLRRVVTLPKDKSAVEISGIQNLIDSVPREDEIYLRVKVETIGNVPESVNAALRNAFRDTNVRYCLAQAVPPPLHEDEKEERSPERSVSIDEMREINPLELADLHFRRKYARPIPQELQTLLDEILTGAPDTSGK